jgi:hypothetical protein
LGQKEAFFYDDTMIDILSDIDCAREVLVATVICAPRNWRLHLSSAKTTQDKPGGSVKHISSSKNRKNIEMEREEKRKCGSSL